MEEICISKIDPLKHWTSNKYFVPENFHEKHPEIEKICHWVLDLEKFHNQNYHGRQHKLDKKLLDFNMPLGSYFRMMSKMKKLGHDA